MADSDVYVLSKYIDEWMRDPGAYDRDAQALVEGVRGLERDLAASEKEAESFRLQLLGEREARCDREADVERLQALVPTWIPCAERLPEHFAWVLIAFCEGVVQRAFLRDDGWVLVGTNQGWVLSSHPYPLRDVTHWMPLPAPPEVPHG